MIRDNWISSDYPQEIVTLCIILRHVTGVTDNNGWGLDLHWRVFQGDLTTLAKSTDIADPNANIEMQYIFLYPKLNVECDRRAIPDSCLYENHIG